jgi:hypothetical protein
MPSIDDLEANRLRSAERRTEALLAYSAARRRCADGGGVDIDRDPEVLAAFAVVEKADAACTLARRKHIAALKATQSLREHAEAR